MTLARRGYRLAGEGDHGAGCDAGAAAGDRGGGAGGRHITARAAPTVEAVANTATGAVTLAAGARDVRQSVQAFREGDWLGGLRHAATGGLALFHGTQVGLSGTRALVGRYSSCQEARIYPWGKNQNSCFAAGTPVRTPEGAKPVEELRPGDLVWARDEADPSGPVVPRQVEANFVRTAVILHLHVGREVIRTTAEHPFYVRDVGWVPAGRLKSGDLLASHGDRWTAVEEVFDTGEWAAVYNVRVAEYHTYFVGGDRWAFSVWAHNAYSIRTQASQYEKTVRSKYGPDQAFKNRTFVIPNGKKGVADRIAIVNGERVAVEAKFTGDWASSIRNPQSKIGNRPFAVTEQLAVVNQTGEYLKAFDKVHIHSNSQGFINHYRNVFSDSGLDMSRISFFLTPA